MFRGIKRSIIKRRLLAQVESEKRLEVLCLKAGVQVAQHYGQIEPRYDVLAEVEILCHELERGV